MKFINWERKALFTKRIQFQNRICSVKSLQNLKKQQYINKSQYTGNMLCQVLNLVC